MIKTNVVKISVNPTRPSPPKKMLEATCRSFFDFEKYFEKIFFLRSLHTKKMITNTDFKSMGFGFDNLGLRNNCFSKF